MRKRGILLAGGVVLGLSMAGLSFSLAGNPPPNDPMTAPPPSSSWSSPDLNPPATPFPLPSDAASVAGAGHFLTYDTNRGHTDTAASACAYYDAIGAGTCDVGTGKLTSSTTFEKWKHDVKIDKYALNGQKTDIAQFVNQVDLNLTRDHHMISYGPDQLAGYVCNHKGPRPTVADPTALFPPKIEINRLISTIKHKVDLVACVAMEYSVNVKYTGSSSTGHPFTRFWIFVPDPTSGSNDLVLATSVDLDNRGPKFVPGVCTACHGGTFAYEDASGAFSKTKSAMGDLDAHFLPFDMANFAFSSKTSKERREDEIFALNLNVHNTENTRTTADPTKAIVASDGSLSITKLIAGWYAKGGGITKANMEPTFDPDFIADAWNTSSDLRVAYHDVIAHSCRTCHAAMDNKAFELTPGLANVPGVACASYDMPNSLVTFNRFWLSNKGAMVPGQPASTVSQPATLAAHLYNSPCNPPTP
jgi:hypothetical protein